MKRLLLLATVLALALGLASVASAATIKASGQWALEFLFSDNFDMNSSESKDGDGDFNVYQRARTQFDFIANENLKGVLATEIGTTRWGDPDGFHFHDHNAGINVRRAYLDFMVPDTKIAVRGGLQGVALPSSFGGGNMILDDELTALVVSAPIIDQVSVLAGYGRLYDFDKDTATASTNSEGNSAFDAGFLAVPVTLDGFQFSPYFLYGYVGEQALHGMIDTGYTNVLTGLITPQGSNSGGRNAYWAGTNFTMTYFDPIKVMADFAWGSVSSSQGGEENERSGWMADLAVDYTGFDFMTPELFFSYVSGDDDDPTNGSERMPSLSSRNYGPGSFWFANDTLLMGSWGYNNDMSGYWIVGLSLKDISFVEKLSHTVNVMYVQGTNDENVAKTAYSTAPAKLYKYGETLTEEDSIIEFDLNNKYKLYDELTLTLDFGYIVNNYDKDTWKASVANLDREDAYKISTGLLYEF
jgi:hypothetical protein